MKAIYNFSVYLYAAVCSVKRVWKDCGLPGANRQERSKASKYIVATIMENLKDDVFEY